MKPLSEAMRARARTALEFVWREVQQGSDAEDIIQCLADKHGATRRFTQGTYVLRCAGITSSNTSNTPDLLVQGWRRRAVDHLSYLNF